VQKTGSPLWMFPCVDERHVASCSETNVAVKDGGSQHLGTGKLRQESHRTGLLGPMAGSVVDELLSQRSGHGGCQGPSRSTRATVVHWLTACPSAD